MTVIILIYVKSFNNMMLASQFCLTENEAQDNNMMSASRAEHEMTI